MSKEEYDAVVIGGGSAGLTAAGFAANLGAKTMMIESEKLGGDCTWTGCVPSKTLLKAARVAQQMRGAGKYGLTNTEPVIDFPKLMRHVHAVRQEIYEEADAPPNFEAMGIDVVQGKASFRDNHTIEIEQTEGPRQTVTSRYFFICTGASPAVPPIKGLDGIHYLTSESLFEIKKRPRKLLIIGAGNVGTEMAQALNRLGTDITVIDQAKRILTNDDRELAAMLQQHLTKEGIRYILDAEITEITPKDEETQVAFTRNGEHKTVRGDTLLMATGRTPNLNGLNLESTAIRHSEKGIEVDSKCCTSVSHIYACGDVTGDYYFTHMSEHMAKVAVSNALLKVPMKVDTDHVPWCTYTDPELAHVGATEQQLKAQDRSFEVFQFPYSKLDRAVTESEELGLIKVYAKKWSGKILGADILGERAGELISEYAVAMKNGVSLRDLSGTIHPYPSYGQGARRAADEWFLQIRPVWLIKLVKKVLNYRGEVPDSDDSDQTI